MKDWNVVVTSTGGGRGERRLLRELQQLGEFGPTGFRGVFLGLVDEPARFLEDLREARELMADTFAVLGHVTPVEEVHRFEPGSIEEALEGAALTFVQRIGARRFSVRVKRRGYKGQVSSMELEQRLAAALLGELSRLGIEAHLDLTDPDAILAVTLFPNRFGLALIGREMRERYPFVKVK